MLNNMQDHSPFSFTVQFLDGSFDNPYAGRENLNLFPYAGDFAPNSPFALPIQVDALEKRLRIPYTQNWNLTLERKVGADWLVRLAYVGTKTTHLMIGVDQNAPIYDFSKSLSENEDTIDQRRRDRNTKTSSPWPPRSASSTTPYRLR